MLSLLITLIACGGDSQPEPLYLTKEYYTWACHDYEDRSEIVVSSNTCEDHESGLYWLVAESHMVMGSGYKRKLDKTADWETDCLYQTELPLFDDYCIEVEGVTLTAYVEPTTWTGALSGE